MADQRAEDFLAHHGVLGMHWGQHKTESGISSHRIDREAKKDAKEHNIAKLYYGEGAGTRRKLIKAKVEGKSARSADYAKAFAYHQANGNTEKNLSKAVGQRHRKDVRNTTTKTARGVGHIIRGNAQYASLGAAALVAGGAYAHSRGYDKVAYSAAKKAGSKAYVAGARFVGSMASRL